MSESMRTEDELQQAHDALVGVILRDAPFPDVGLSMRDFNLMAQVLCWVMHHDHNTQFALTLERIRADLRAQGFELAEGARKPS